MRRPSSTKTPASRWSSAFQTRRRLRLRSTKAALRFRRRPRIASPPSWPGAGRHGSWPSPAPKTRMPSRLPARRAARREPVCRGGWAEEGSAWECIVPRGCRPVMAIVFRLRVASSAPPSRYEQSPSAIALAIASPLMVVPPNANVGTNASMSVGKGRTGSLPCRAPARAPRSISHRGRPGTARPWLRPESPGSLGRVAL